MERKNIKSAAVTTSLEGGVGKLLLILSRKENIEIVHFMTLVKNVGFSIKPKVLLWLCYLFLIKYILRQGRVNRILPPNLSLWNRKKLLRYFESFDSVKFYRVVNMLSVDELESVIASCSHTELHLMDHSSITPYCSFVGECRQIGNCAQCPATKHRHIKRRIKQSARSFFKSNVFSSKRVEFVAYNRLDKKLIEEISSEVNIKLDVLPFYRKSEIQNAQNRTSYKRILFTASRPTDRKGFDLIPGIIKKLESNVLISSAVEIVICTKFSASYPKIYSDSVKITCVDTLKSEEFEDLISNCDVFCSLSRRDSGPYTVNIALALGLKVISGRVGVAELLSDNANVTIVDKLDIDSVVKALETVTC